MASPCKMDDDLLISAREADWLCYNNLLYEECISARRFQEAGLAQQNCSSSLTRARPPHPRALVMNTRVGLGKMATT